MGSVESSVIIVDSESTAMRLRGRPKLSSFSRAYTGGGSKADVCFSRMSFTVHRDVEKGSHNQHLKYILVVTKKSTVLLCTLLLMLTIMDDPLATLLSAGWGYVETHTLETLVSCPAGCNTSDSTDSASGTNPGTKPYHKAPLGLKPRSGIKVTNETAL